MPVFNRSDLKDRIFEILNENKVAFKHLKHEAALTADQAAARTNYPKEKSIKSLIVKGRKTKNHYLAAILGYQKLNMKAFASIVAERCEFESLENVKEIYGIDQGGVAPFGNLLNLTTFFDESILELEECIIGAGLPTESIILKASDLIKIIRPKIYKITK